MLKRIQLSFIIGIIAIASISFATNKIEVPVGTIPGWPTYLAMGTVTNNAPSVGIALAATPVDAIFKYAGFNGSGDRGEIIDPTTTENTVAQAHYIEQNSVAHHKVMPVMVVYTIDASGSIYDAVNDIMVNRQC